MSISTRGRYGLRALLDLAAQKAGKPVPLSDIAQRQAISEGYLEQLMACLKKAGLVQSTRGVQGGYVLTRKPDEITVLQVLTPLENSLTPATCVSEESAFYCERQEYCPTRFLWQKVKEAMDHVLSSYTLADLLQKGKEQKEA